MVVMLKWNVGDIINGVVTGITKYGIFLKFSDGYTGLIHISEISENYVSDVSNFANINDEIPCKIIDIDKDNKQIKASIKNTTYGLEKDSYINHGFTPLKKHLSIWIDEKKKEYHLEEE